MELTKELQKLITYAQQTARDEERANIGESISKLVEASHANEMPSTFIAGLNTALEVVTHASASDIESKDVE